MWLRLAGRTWPRVVSGLADVVLQFIEGLNCDADNVFLVRLAIHAEICVNISARHANVIVSQLARELSLVCGIP
jgi:hypothetical protein